MDAMREDEVIAPKREHKTRIRLKKVKRILALSVQFVESHGGKVARRLIETKQRKSKVIYGHHRNKSNPIYEPDDVFLVSRKPRSNGWTKKFIVAQKVNKSSHPEVNSPNKTITRSFGLMGRKSYTTENTSDHNFIYSWY
jgi:hypothetical protein